MRYISMARDSLHHSANIALGTNIDEIVYKIIRIDRVLDLSWWRTDDSSPPKPTTLLLKSVGCSYTQTVATIIIIIIILDGVRCH